MLLFEQEERAAIATVVAAEVFVVFVAGMIADLPVRTKPWHFHERICASQHP